MAASSRGKRTGCPWRNDVADDAPTITMYTTANCPFCVRAERFLDARGVTDIA